MVRCVCNGLDASSAINLGLSGELLDLANTLMHIYAN